MNQLLLEYGSLWVMVSTGMACLVIAVGAWGKSDVPMLSTATMAVAAATLWPLFTALVVGLLLIGAAVLLGVGLCLLPPNIILAIRGKEIVKPYATKAEVKS